MQSRGQVKFKSSTVANSAIIALSKGGVESAKRGRRIEVTVGCCMQNAMNLLTALEVEAGRNGLLALVKAEFNDVICETVAEGGGTSQQQMS